MSVAPCARGLRCGERGLRQAGQGGEMQTLNCSPAIVASFTDRVTASSGMGAGGATGGGATIIWGCCMCICCCCCGLASPGVGSRNDGPLVGIAMAEEEEMGERRVCADTVRACREEQRHRQTDRQRTAEQNRQLCLVVEVSPATARSAGQQRGRREGRLEGGDGGGRETGEKDGG
jgi:hypothetical protein